MENVDIEKSQPPVQHKHVAGTITALELHNEKIYEVGRRPNGYKEGLVVESIQPLGQSSFVVQFRDSKHFLIIPTRAVDVIQMESSNVD
jgi:hypothetical protein